MAEIMVSSSSDKDARTIDEYHDENNTSGSNSDSDSSCSSSNVGNTTDKQYSSGVPRVPLEILQEKMRTRVASGSSVVPSTSAPLFASSSEEENLYCCAIGIPSKIDKKKLNSLRIWY